MPPPLLPDRAACRRPAAMPFIWATGIEDTFIATPWPATGRTLDEYALTGHYRQWRGDLDRLAALGVPAARYGLPWYRVQPGPRRWDWGWADRVLDRFARLGISPMLDCVHYGTPRWMPQGFLDPDFPPRMAEFCATVALRYRDRLRWVTPMNEPRIAAWYAGMLGWWPPGRRGWRGFLAVLLAAARGIAASIAALRAATPELAVLHVDASDLYIAAEPALEREAALRQALVFLVLDLLDGRVGPGHALHDWLLDLGVGPAALEPFRDARLDIDVLGINLYPMFTLKRLERAGRGHRVRMVYATGALIEQLFALYATRCPRPLMITETASRGTVRRRLAWLETSVAAVRAARAAGLPVIGYTWWPLFSMIAWAYRQGTLPFARYLLHLGLYDIDPDDPGLARRPTALVEAYRALVAGGENAVGRLNPPPAPRHSRVRVAG